MYCFNYSAFIVDIMSVHLWHWELYWPSCRTTV